MGAGSPYTEDFVMSDVRVCSSKKKERKDCECGDKRGCPKNFLNLPNQLLPADELSTRDAQLVLFCSGVTAMSHARGWVLCRYVSLMVQ